MRAGPDASFAPPAEEIADPVARDLEPCLAHPARREVVRGILLGRVPGPVLRDRVDLVEALRPSRGQWSQHAPAREREQRDDEEPGAPRRRGDESAEERRVGGARHVEERLLQPDREPLRPWPASSTAAANERLFQLIENTPAAMSTGMSTPSGASIRAAVRATKTRRAERDRAAAARCRLAAQIRPAAGGDPALRPRAAA